MAIRTWIGSRRCPRRPKRMVPRDVKSMKFQVILYELEQCRQDDRDAIMRMLQVIMLGVTALAFMFTGYATFSAGAKDAGLDMGLYSTLFTAMGIATIVAAFFYLASIGITSGLRYHYMRDLEAALDRQMPMGKDLMHWAALSAPVITLNSSHVRSRFTAFHLASTLLAVGGSLIMGLISFAVFSQPLDIRVKVLIFVLGLPFAALFILVSANASGNSRKVYEFAREEAKRREEGANTRSGPPRRGLASAILYFIYPRPQDALKVGFILLGVATFCSLGVGQFDPVPVACETVLVLDVLVYQARYQLNDIRGAKEDQENPRSGSRRRLPVEVLGLQTAVAVSLLVFWYRLLLAAAFIWYLFDSTGPALLAGLVATFALAALYEVARARRKKWAVPILVGLGYPLRFAVGFLAAWSACGHREPLGEATILACLLVCLSILIYGFAFVWITWAHESWDRRRSGMDDSKPHVRLMGDYISCDDLQEAHPLRSRGNLFSPWNLAMVSSGIVMLAAILLSGDMKAAAACALLCILIIFDIAMPRQPKNVALMGCVGGVAAGALAFVIKEVGGIEIASMFGSLQVVALSAFFAVFVSFRDSNYEEMADFARPISEALHSMRMVLLKSLIDENVRDAYLGLRKDSSDAGEGKATDD